MAHRIIYKGQDSKICSLSEATLLVAEEGWSWVKPSASKPTKAKKSAKAKQVFKVEAEAEVKPKSSEDDDMVNIDFGTIKEE